MVTFEEDAIEAEAIVRVVVLSEKPIAEAVGGIGSDSVADRLA